MISNSKDRSNFTFLLAFSLLNIVGLMLLSGGIMFAFKQSLSVLNFPISVLLGVSINFFACKYYFKEFKYVFLWLTLISFALLLVALITASYFYDMSWDGQQYHQEILIQLKNGWNPFYDVLSDKIDYALWMNHYGKGAEIPQAIIYIFFNKIEAGKATNILLLFASFFLSVSFLFKLNRFKSSTVFLISMLLCLNPVFITQLFTYYVDIQLGLLLLCLLIICMHLFLEVENYKLFLLSIILLVTLNIKFTAIPFVGIFIAGMLFALFYTKRINAFKHVFINSTISSIIAIVFIGFNPYITNTIKSEHPFYPLAGKGKVDIMQMNSPLGFSENNRFQNFIISLFSKSANITLSDRIPPEIKIPFTVSASEFKTLGSSDVRVGGFGFLFSGIFILSLILLYFVIISASKPIKFLIFSVLATITVTIVIMEHSWWARYVPQLWFIPIIILAAYELIIPTRNVKWLKNAIYILLLVNITVITMLTLKNNFLTTIRIEHSLRELAAMKNNVQYVDFKDFKATRIKFDENNLNFPTHTVDSGIIFKIKATNTSVKLKANYQKLEMPAIIKVYEKLFPAKNK